MHAYRAAILRFADDHTAVYDDDGLLVVGPDATGRPVVRAVGAYHDLAPNFPGVAVEHLPGRILAPGFVDLHVHYPQTDVIGSPADGLLPWLENYTFPHESRFAEAAHARGVAAFFLDELARNGVTTALTFATSHPQSVDAGSVGTTSWITCFASATLLPITFSTSSIDTSCASCFQQS